MTRGFLCNGESCGVFIVGSPAASYTHHVVWAEVDESERVEGRDGTVEAHFCVDCAIRLSKKFDLFGGISGEDTDDKA